MKNWHRIVIMVVRMWVGFGMDGVAAYLAIAFDSQVEKGIVGFIIAVEHVELVFLAVTSGLAFTTVMQNDLGRRTVAALFKLLSVSHAIGLLSYTVRNRTREEWKSFIDEENTSFAVVIISALDIFFNILELGFHVVMWIVIFWRHSQEKKKKRISDTEHQNNNKNKTRSKKRIQTQSITSALDAKLIFDILHVLGRGCYLIMGIVFILFLVCYIIMGIVYLILVIILAII